MTGFSNPAKRQFNPATGPVVVNKHLPGPLGFFDIMALGMHHQDYHWMMAADSNPHY